MGALFQKLKGVLGCIGARPLKEPFVDFKNNR